EEKLKAAFEEFKKYEDGRVEKRCAKMDARLDALSIDFDEELYPHMLTSIAGRRWVIGHSLRLAVMKCGESTELRQANLDLKAIEAYDSEADTKYVAALHALRDLKYPMVDQLESLKDASIDVIMASLHLEGDSGEDASQWIRELRPSSFQLKIPVYPEVHDPKDPWSFKEEILLVDAIVANVSRAEKKKNVGWCVVPMGSVLRIMPEIATGMSGGLKYGVEHGKANLSLEAIEAYDPEAETKYISAFHALKDLKYPMVDQPKSLKDAPIDV
nr:hypothetical protein [Tanacetum cinerariifolium]